jgi:hypothetical protein
MRETERQKTERLLKEQLDRFQREDSTWGRRYAIGLPLPSLLSRLHPVRRGGETAETRRGWMRWLPGGRMQQPATGSPKEAAAHRGELAFDDLYAAVLSDRPRTVSNGGDEGAVPWLRSPAHAHKHDLPNVSSRGARLAAMKEASARDWGPPPKVQFPRPDKKKRHRSDFVVAALGVVLGLTCALFPWYIFFNQDQFGVQAISFGGRGHNAGRIMVDPKPGEDASDVARQEISKNLDLFSTGTVPAKPETPDQAPGIDQQPFPAEAAEFRLVHVANGRAMIEDDAGLWIVQQGSSLPDSTHVKSIEQRKGRWVLVTSADRVIELSK